jgi:putative transposase
MKRFMFIERMKKAYPIEMLCRFKRVSSRGFRAWRARPLSVRAREDMILSAHLRAQAKFCNFSYGRIRMTMELKELGFSIGERRTARLIAVNDIKVIRTQKYKRTTDSNHAFPFAENLLERDFVAETPNQKWVTDISYIWTREGWLYLAVVIDLFSRKIIGWATSDRLKRDLALRMALTRRRPLEGCIHHSDLGSQYCAYEYQKLLQAHGLRASMSGKGNAYDNAACASFFKTIKAELIWRGQWITRTQTEMAIGNYIDRFYNPVRKHSAVGYLAPMKFEEKMKARNRKKYAA